MGTMRRAHLAGTVSTPTTTTGVWWLGRVGVFVTPEMSALGRLWFPAAPESVQEYASRRHILSVPPSTRLLSRNVSLIPGLGGARDRATS